jgi:ferric-dicitrate binding protein FerR (iron transport regulator)
MRTLRGKVAGFGARTLREPLDRVARRYLISTALAVACVLTVYVGAFRQYQRLTPARTYTTATRERATMRLPDGTQVTLAPNTSVTVDAGFGVTNRSLHLTGQAYFAVVAGAAHPFVVHTGDIATRVLGTTFTVRHYASDREVVVAVQSGKVVTGWRTPVVLTRDMLAHVTDSTVTVAAGADLREYLEWTQGHLVFNNVRAAELVKVLGQWYGLTFRFADSTLQSHPLTGAFDDRYPQQEVLQNLQLLLGVQMQFDGNTVTLISRPPVKTVWPRRTPKEFGPPRMEVGQ